MFNFNFDWGAIADFNTNFNPVAFQQEVAALANIATVAAVNSPAVVSAPANVAPAPTAVQPVVQQVIQAVAPVIAPSVPAPIIAKLERIIPEEVVSNPQVVASPAGVAVPPAALNTIASSISSTFKNDAQKDAEIRTALQQVASTPTSTPNTLAGSLDSLNTGITESKNTVKEKNVEIATIALEQAVNTGNTIAAASAAGDLADAQGLTSVEKIALINKARQDAQTTVESNRQLSKPTEDPGPGNIWSYNVSEGKWKKVSTGVSTTNLTTSLTTTNLTTTNLNTTSLDAATTSFIQGLQTQISNLTASLGKQDAAAAQAKVDATAATAAAQKEKAENAINVLTDRFTRYGLASLVPKIKELAVGGASESTITLQLQDTEEYRQRFKANQDRIKKGLSVLEPGEYLGIEDKYRQILRAYGLKQFDNDNYVSQFISNDISSAELTSRVQTAVQRVQNADPAVLNTLTQYYGIGNTDLVGYILDPEQQFQKIERQVAAAEIGVAAGLQGFKPGVAVAEQLAAQGVSEAEARKGYSTIADILPTAEKLSQIYGTTMEGYGLAEAEQEVFNSLASAQRKRRRLSEREIASFAGASGKARINPQNTAGQL